MTVTSTSNPGQSGPRSKNKDRNSTLTKTPELEPHHSMQFSIISSYSFLFANGPGNLGSIPDRVIPKTLKMVLDTPLLNTQQYKVRIKGKVEQSMERSSTLPYTLV